ncbi:MAG: hypothetical protein OEV42_07930 [Deltaproteobacteria bacterium]|nr:hypothetical protein [Deltaproteobacteria bacterium]
MPVKLKNLTNRPVLIRLNSGQSLHLAPRVISADIPDVEVKSNAKVEKLRKRRVIDLAEGKKKVPPVKEVKGEPEGGGKTKPPKGGKAKPVKE